MAAERVLVTGGSGFIAAYCIAQLLEAGYSVRTTVRSRSRERDVLAMLHAAGIRDTGSLSFAEANLSADGGWAEAVEGCTYVLHVASPFPFAAPQHEDELIVPARDGALRVLRASRDAGVRRVVLTSSFAAIGYGAPPLGRPFNESDWTHLDGPGVSAYVKSKTIAERAAWDFIASEGGALELSAVNPVGVFGPVLGPDFSTSIQIVKRLMDGQVPGVPKLSFGVVDVRDVADLHIRAMTSPAARGERFLCVAGDFMTMLGIAQTLRATMGEAARRVPTRTLPNWLVKVAAKFDRSLGQIVPELDKSRNATNEKARRLLDWSPRSNIDALKATAQSLLDLDLLAEAKKAA